MRARFRRIVGTFGAVSLIVGTAAAAVITISSAAAGAGTVSAFSADLAAPTNLNQNTIGYPGVANVGVINAGDGWSFTITNWVAGDTVDILTGTPNGGPGIECNTVQPDGVNQTHVDPGNYVYFSGYDAGGVNNGNGTGTDSPIIETTGGTVAPIITTSVSMAASTAFDGINVPKFSTTDCPSNDTHTATGVGVAPANSGITGDLLTLTFVNSAVSGAAAQVFVGYANTVGNPSSSVSEPVVYDTGFGAATGPVPFSATYVPASPLGGPAPVVVPSAATVVGETPAANNPALGVVRTTGAETVAAQSISNFTITETGESLGIDLPLVSGNLPPNSGPQGFGNANPGNTTPTAPLNDATEPTTTVPAPDGAVCLVIDNSTGQNLEFSSPLTGFPNWSVNPGANTVGFSATAGSALLINTGTASTLELPVTSPSNAPTTWTASNLGLKTIPGDVTNADGPVWAFAYWVPGPEANVDGDPSCVTSGAAGDNVGNPPSTVGDPGSYELGYVQLSTVDELANSVYGDTEVDTAAQAIGHQFNYANGQCVGTQFPQFFNGGPLFVATDADYHDALGADYPAGADDTGVALTDPGSVPQGLLDIIRQEGVQTIYLVGGDLAIYDAVQTQLANTPSYLCGGVNPRFNVLGQPENLTVIRIAGFTADDTNLKLATFVGAQPPTPYVPFGAFATPTLFNDTGTGMSTAAPTNPVQNIAVVVSDAGFQDAVSASALAYGWPLPLVVTAPTGLTSDALAALADQHVTEVILVGGVDAVSDAVVTQLNGFGISVLRVAGFDGSDTSTQLAAFELASLPVVSMGNLPTGLAENNNDGLWQNFVNRTAGLVAPPAFNDVHAHAIDLARGDAYYDALTAAAVLSIHNGFFASATPFKPVLLTESPSSLGSYVTKFLGLAGVAVSGLGGASPSWGHTAPISWGNQIVNASSNVYTIQPIGGIFALAPSTLAAALAALTTA